MALTRKFLSAMGIDDAKIDEIISAHTETVNALKEERDSYKADAQKLSSVQKELDMAKESMANGDKSPYKVKYDAKVEELDELKKEFENYKADAKKKEDHAKKMDAYRQLLKEAGVSERRIDAIMKISDVDVVEFDKDDKVKDADKLTESIKSEWSDFIVTQSEQGANTSKPPQNNGGNKMTRADIYKKDENGRYVLSSSERQKALMENGII